MKRNSMQPLTEQEKFFAESNHGLVYSFLHRYGYKIEDFYDIVIFGFLRAVQIYHRKEELNLKYDFAFIAWQYMRAEVGNYFRVESALKRKPMETILSLDVSYTETDNLYNIIAGKSVEDDLLESELLNEVLENLSAVQRGIFNLKLEGYTNKEVHTSLKIPTSTYYKELARIKVIFKRLVG